MNRWERWTFGLLTLGVLLSGGVYFWMKYLLVNDDPFSVVNHPWQSAMLAAHVLAAPGLLLMFGILVDGARPQKGRDQSHNEPEIRIRLVRQLFRDGRERLPSAGANLGRGARCDLRCACSQRSVVRGYLPRASRH